MTAGAQGCAVSDGFEQPFKVRDSQQGCYWRQCFLLKGNSDQGRIQIGKENVSNILSRKNSSQVRSCDDRDLVWRLRITIAGAHCIRGYDMASEAALAAMT